VEDGQDGVSNPGDHGVVLAIIDVQQEEVGYDDAKHFHSPVLIPFLGSAVSEIILPGEMGHQSCSGTRGRDRGKAVEHSGETDQRQEEGRETRETSH